MAGSLVLQMNQRARRRLGREEEEAERAEEIARRAAREPGEQIQAYALGKC